MLQTKQLRLLFHSSSFSSLSFFLRHQASPFFSSCTLFSSQSHCFSLFLSDITLSFFFSLFSSFTLISVTMGFFFFLIPGSVVGGLRWWLADHWWWVAMVKFSGGWRRLCVCVCVCVCVFFFFLVVCGRNNFSGCGLFAYKVVLMDVGLCWWWLSMVVVGVVATEVVVPLLLMMMMMGK